MVAWALSVGAGAEGVRLTKRDETVPGRWLSCTSPGLPSGSRWEMAGEGRVLEGGVSVFRRSGDALGEGAGTKPEEEGEGGADVKRLEVWGEVEGSWERGAGFTPQGWGLEEVSREWGAAESLRSWR